MPHTRIFIGLNYFDISTEIKSQNTYECLFYSPFSFKINQNCIEYWVNENLTDILLGNDSAFT